MHVDQQRLRDDLETNASFGSIDVDEGHGRTVLTGTEAEKHARDYFVEQLETAGLEVQVDEVGNIVGRWTPESADLRAAPVAAGSHLDSVPEGGMFDGPLGVYAALEAVRTLQERDVEMARPIEVVNFTEEEGARFGALLGSSVAAGKQTVEETLQLSDENGTSLEEALEEIGYRGEGTIDASEWDAWLELHIEQGGHLERVGASVGVVSAITGIIQADARIKGEANHAGTTSMQERTDSLAAAAEFILDVEDAAGELLSTSETVVATVGKLNVTPNATNVIPGSARIGIDIRDVTRSTMDSVYQQAQESLERSEAERGVETKFEKQIDIDPIPMTNRCQEAFHSGAEYAGIDAVNLHSGAGHDSMQIADVTDAGMIFAPSRDGISHNPTEWTDWNDCARATEVLANALAELASDT